VAKLKNFGILNLYIMGTIKQKLKPTNKGTDTNTVYSTDGNGPSNTSPVKVIKDAAKSKSMTMAYGGPVKRKLMKASKGVIIKKKTVKKYQPGGPTGRTKYEGPVTKEMTDVINKDYPETNVPFVSNPGSDMLKKYSENRDRRDTGTTMRRGGATKKYMTGGMVNSNAKVSALKSAGSKGVKSGVNAKAKASTTAKGRTGGTSKAPKGATPTKNKRG
jgi:hypothetical protein